MIVGLHTIPGNKERLTRVVFRFALFNLLMVAIVGVFLRIITVTGFGVSFYKNILHAHSHFALGGWVMPALLALQIKYYPELANKISYRHWWNIATMLLLSAYGMLLSFPFQGYGLVSICFSTLSVLASFYLAFVSWKGKAELARSTSLSFLIAGLFYLVISSIGPLATAPLIAMGKAGTTLYFNAIYFYLHFQYNGWFGFILLGVFYKIIDENKAANGTRVFMLMNLSCIPAYFLSTLWSHPPLFFYILGGGAGILQIVALFYLCQDILRTRQWKQRLPALIFTALIVFSVKLVLQLIAAFRITADMAYQHRNFIIAYLHLVLLGFVTLFIFGANAEELQRTATSRKVMSLFIGAWIIMVVILVLQALGEIFLFHIPGYEKWILGVSCFLPFAVFFLWIETYKGKTRAVRFR